MGSKSKYNGKKTKILEGNQDINFGKETKVLVGSKIQKFEENQKFWKKNQNKILEGNQKFWRETKHFGIKTKKLRLKLDTSGPSYISLQNCNRMRR